MLFFFFTFIRYFSVSSSTPSPGSGRQLHFYDEVQLELLDSEFTKDSFPDRDGPSLDDDRLNGPFLARIWMNLILKSKKACHIQVFYDSQQKISIA
jgi:hypothetical protein